MSKFLDELPNKTSLDVNDKLVIIDSEDNNYNKVVAIAILNHYFATGGGSAVGTNTGDETGPTIAGIINDCTEETTLEDTDKFAISKEGSSTLKRISWAKIKTSIKSFFESSFINSIRLGSKSNLPANMKNTMVYSSGESSIIPFNVNSLKFNAVCFDTVLDGTSVQLLEIGLADNGNNQFTLSDYSSFANLRLKGFARLIKLIDGKNTIIERVAFEIKALIDFEATGNNIVISSNTFNVVSQKELRESNNYSLFEDCTIVATSTQFPIIGLALRLSSLDIVAGNWWNGGTLNDLARCTLECAVDIEITEIIKKGK